MYRPFVSCDDPKGVVECSSVRSRSLSCVPKKDERVGRGRPEAERRSSSFSLEVSGETRKFGQVLDAWSKKLRGDHSKETVNEIAESLALLEKMQTSSSPMRKCQGSGVAGEGSRRRNRKCYSVKQNEMSLGSPAASSVKQLSRSKSWSCSSSSRSQQGNQQGPNLIARLMGVEELPSKPLQRLRSQRLPGEKTLTPVFDIKAATPRRSYETPPQPDPEPEPKTLDDVLETMRNVGLLASTSPASSRSHHSLDDGYSDKRLIAEVPPVVLIKPRPNSIGDLDEAIKIASSAKGNSKRKPRSKVQECYVGTRARYGDQYLLERGIQLKKYDGGDGCGKSKPRRKTEARSDAKLQNSYDIRVVNHDEQFAKWQIREVDFAIVERKKTTVDEEPFQNAIRDLNKNLKMNSWKDEEPSQKKIRGNENRVKILLMNSLSFAIFVEEFFHGEIKSHKRFPVMEHEEPKACEAKLVVDYAKEFVKRRAGREDDSLLSKSCLSFEQLVEAICNGVETLVKHSHEADSLWHNVDRDLGCNGEVCGTWEGGWRKGFSFVEPEEILVDLQRLILHDLISELVK